MRTSRRRLRPVGVLLAASTAAAIFRVDVERAGAARGQVDGRREGRQRRQLGQRVLQAERAGGQHQVRDRPHHGIRAAQEALEGVVEEWNVLQAIM